MELKNTKRVNFESQKQWCEFIKPRLKEYDVCTIGQYLRILHKPRSYKGIIKSKPVIERIAVTAHNFEVFASPSFFDEMGIQVQKQMEEVLGINNLHRIPNLNLILHPFYSGLYVEGLDYIQVKEGGICYSYAPCTITSNNKLWEWWSELIMFWIRYYSLETPEVPVDPGLDYSSGKIKFEICDTLPTIISDDKDFFKKLDEVFFQRKLGIYNYWKNEFQGDQIIKDSIQYPNRSRDTGEAKIVKNLFEDLNRWQDILKDLIEFVNKKNKIAERRALKKKSVEEKPIPVEYPKEILYWPDIIFHLRMCKTVNEDTIEELKDIVDECFESIQGERPELFQVDKVGENDCDITVDFGMSSPRTMKKLITWLGKTGVDIEKIVVEG